MLTLLGLLICIPQAVPVWFFARRRGGPKLLGNWVRTAGWLTLWVLPAVVAQAVFNGAGFSSTTFDTGALFAMLPWSWPVLLGGASVQMIFEETAKNLSGHRQSTMMDNLGYYLVLTWLQLALVSLFCAIQCPEGPRLRQRVSLTIGLLVLANALCGITWPWWGT
jgi:hypothetical protein